MKKVLPVSVFVAALSAGVAFAQTAPPGRSSVLPAACNNIATNDAKALCLTMLQRSVYSWYRRYRDDEGLSDARREFLNSSCAALERPIRADAADRHTTMVRCLDQVQLAQDRVLTHRDPAKNAVAALKGHLMRLSQELTGRPF